MSPSPSSYVVLGAGQVGPLVARRLAALGHAVTVVRRSAPAAAEGGIRFAAADLSDPTRAAEVMAGATAVIHCATPPYHRWTKELVPLNHGIVRGAAKAGARLVVLDNLYAYGSAPGGVMREDSPVAPRSQKGKVRAEAAAEILGAAKRGELQAVVARASDFFGPGARMTGVFGDRFWQRLLRGASVEYLGDPGALHSYSYLPDVAEGLVTLATTDDPSVYGRVWHLPVGAAESTLTWIQRFAEAAGRAPKSKEMSALMLRIVGLFLPQAGEVVEMLYQWQAPFVLDDAAFRARFGAAPTPTETIVSETVAWAKKTYA